MTGFRLAPDNISIIEKSPDAFLDYMQDWSAWLATGETIVSIALTASVGITTGLLSQTTTKITVWLQGGTVGSSYLVTLRITTSAGRIESRSIRVAVVVR